MTTNSDNEAARLAERYAQMSDGELELIADSSADLTGEAKVALQQELDKRGLSSPPSRTAPASPISELKVAVADPTPDEPEIELDNASLQQWAVVRRFRDLPEATLAKGALDSAGIECHLADENLIRLNWFISNFVGGVKLVVKPQELEAALQVLDEPIPPEIQYEEGDRGAFEQPPCPTCGSLDISFEDANKGAALLSLYVVRTPLHIESRRWRCSACGFKWTESQETT